MSTRLAKIGLLAAVSLYLALVVFNNLDDYNSNYQFVHHVLAMDTTFPGNAGMWRAINSVPVHHAFLWTIILWEVIAFGFTSVGAWRLWKVRWGSAAVFNRCKGVAIAGLAINLLMWLGAFLAVGAEWFLMWQSDTWNGRESAARMFTVVGLVLLFVNMPDEEL